MVESECPCHNFLFCFPSGNRNVPIDETDRQRPIGSRSAPRGLLIVTLKPSVEHELIRWVLGESGHIEVLYPEDMRRKVAEAALKIWQRNSSLSVSSEFSMEAR